jgi:hypothetical protein
MRKTLILFVLVSLLLSVTAQAQKSVADSAA